eukprot:378003-Rhodomonas_salina.3
MRSRAYTAHSSTDTQHSAFMPCAVCHGTRRIRSIRPKRSLQQHTPALSQRLPYASGTKYLKAWY